MNDSTKHPQPAEADVKEPEDRLLPSEDDRYPGSFFKIPGVPRPGTGWRIS